MEHVAGRSILILNWRCPSHPWAGGAEQYIWQLATRLAGAGALVTLLAASTPGRPAEEFVQGVHLLRRGGTYSVYVRAALYLIRKRRRLDVIIDCQNGIPFFAPVFVVSRTAVVILVIHHVHQDQFATRFKWPMTWIGRTLEGPCTRWVYRHRPIVAVSPSTRADVRHRLRLRGPVFVVPNGLATERVGSTTALRDSRPRIAYVGRLVPHKRLELLLDALAELRASWPKLTLDIAGTGPCLGHLMAYAEDAGQSGAVRFLGQVSDLERDDLFTQAWLMVVPSSHEGWGLTVLEANLCGCPALGFRVPGLVDSIVPGQTGWLADGPAHLTEAIGAALKSLSHPDARAAQARRCQEWAGGFSWQRSAERLAGIITAQGWPSGRRHFTDLVTVAVLEMDGDCAQAVLQLPPDCLWQLHGHTLEILVYGLDTLEVAPWLAALGFRGTLATRVACSRDLLLGPAVHASRTASARAASSPRFWSPAGGWRGPSGR